MKLIAKSAFRIVCTLFLAQMLSVTALALSSSFTLPGPVRVDGRFVITEMSIHRMLRIVPSSDRRAISAFSADAGSTFKVIAKCTQLDAEGKCSMAQPLEPEQLFGSFQSLDAMITLVCGSDDVCVAPEG